MIEALLYAVRDQIRQAGLGYDVRTCEIMPDGHPPPRCGDVFAAVHQAGPRSENDNCLNEYFSFYVTLTMRVTGVATDRIGDTIMARKLAHRNAPGGAPSFNARVEQMRAMLHMDWGVLGDANTNIVTMNPDANVVYGFCEPARYRGHEDPQLVGGEWFSAEPDALDMGLKAELRFEDARRLQPIATYV